MRRLSTSSTLRATTSEIRSPAAYAVISRARCLRPGTAWKKRTTSSGLRTTGSFLGCLGQAMRCRASSRPRVTLLGAGDAVQGFVPTEGDPVEEPEGGDGLVVIAPGDVLLLDERDEVGTDLGRAEVFGRLAEVACEGGDPLDIDLDGPGGEVAELQVLDHALAQRCHDVLLC